MGSTIPGVAPPYFPLIIRAIRHLSRIYQRQEINNPTTSSLWHRNSLERGMFAYANLIFLLIAIASDRA